MPQVGQTLRSYHLLRSLDKSPYAEIFLGEDIYDSSSKVAVKVFSTVHLSGADVDDFKREAEEIAIRLKHPRINPLPEFGIDGDIPYLVMKYAPNGTLRQQHPEGQPLPLVMIVSYIKDIASTLHYVHSQSRVHGNLKPQNILLGMNRELLLADFDIATVSKQLKDQGMIDIGDYMALEQLHGNLLAASDQFALGVMVHEWICGRRPFTGHPNAVAFQQAHTLPEPLRNKVPGISPAVEHVVITALARDPARRYANIQEFADALEQAVSNTRPVTPNAQNSQTATFHNASTVQNIQPPTFPLPGQQAIKKKRPSFLQRLFAFEAHNLQRFSTRSGRYFLFGGAGDIISSIILGLTLQSWWVWLWALIGSLLVRAVCAGLVRREVATPLAVILAFYRAEVGWLIESSINTATHFGWLPPPGVVATIFFIISVILNVRFTRSKS